MKKIFYNANIRTLDDSKPVAEAVAIEDGKITAVGTNNEIMALASKNTELIDLKGATMLPGFTDTHMHLLFYAMEMSCVNLTGCKSLDELKSRCIERLPQAEKDGKWLQGIGFDQNIWDNSELPTRKDLDEISREIPVIIKRACHHITVCNTKALELSGLLNEDPQDTKFSMGFYEDKTPNGIVREFTQGIVSDAMPPLTYEDVKELILQAGHLAASKGITEIHTDDFAASADNYSEIIIRAYSDLAKDGSLPVRIYQQCNLPDTSELEKFLSMGYRTGDDFGLYRIGPLKIISDGSLGAHTAAMREPYKNDPSTRGVLNYSDYELFALCRKGAENNMQIAIHCIGDGALEQSLKVLSKVQQEIGSHNSRHGIVHCQIMDKTQQDEFKKQKLLAYIQPVFVKADMNIVDECVGEDLAKSSYNWRRFNDIGVHQCGGSDCPVEDFDILPNIQYAVTRTNPESGKSWYPQNALSVDEAVKCFTSGGAYASFAENRRGMIKAGFDADFAITDKDIFSIDPNKISSINVIMTVMNGNITYKA